MKITICKYNVAMSLPNLTRLSHRDAKCEPCGVTRQGFSFLLPGVTLAPGQSEPLLHEQDYDCPICIVHLNYPSEGFIANDGEVFQMQQALNDNKTSTPTEEEKEQYQLAANLAADDIRKSNPKRTQVELLLPGCGHQFHRLCLQKQVTSEGDINNKCPSCKTLIDPIMLANLRGESSSSGSPRGIVRERMIPEPDDDAHNDAVRRLEALQAPEPLAPLAPRAPALSGFLEPALEAIRESMRTYFTAIEGARLDVENALSQVSPDFASTAEMNRTRAVLRWLRLKSTIYIRDNPDDFAAYGTRSNAEWDREIGNAILAFYQMEAALDRLDNASATRQGVGRENYLRITERAFPTLIRMLVPSDRSDNVMAYFRLGTSWRYQVIVNGLTLDGGAQAAFALRLYRSVEIVHRNAASLTLTLSRFILRMRRSADLDNETKWTLYTLCTMLLAAMKETIEYGRTGELITFNAQLQRRFATLFATTDANDSFVELAQIAAASAALM